MSLGDVIVYFPILTSGSISCAKRKASSTLGKSVVKSGLFFFTSRECEMHIKIMVDISRQVRKRKEDYSHVAIEFISPSDAKIKRHKYKPRKNY
jgi:hypothetical protein